VEDPAQNNPPIPAAAPIIPATETIPPGTIPGTIPGTMQNPASQSPDSQPLTPEPAPPAQKKYLPKRFLIIIAIVVALVAIGGVLLLKKNTSSLPQKSSDHTRSGPETQQSGLKIYKNSSNKFSVQYPDELQVTEKAVGMGVTTVELRSKDNLDEDYLADIQMMTIPKYLAKAIGQDFDEYYNMSDNTSKTIAAEDKSRVITKVKNRSIHDLRAFDFKSTGDAEDKGTTIGVYIETGDKIVIISTQEENREELETMISNFTYNP
jgi:hypothetical protein